MPITDSGAYEGTSNSTDENGGFLRTLLDAEPAIKQEDSTVKWVDSSVFVWRVYLGRDW